MTEYEQKNEEILNSIEDLESKLDSVKYLQEKALKELELEKWKMRNEKFDHLRKLMGKATSYKEKADIMKRMEETIKPVPKDMREIEDDKYKTSSKISKIEDHPPISTKWSIKKAIPIDVPNKYWTEQIFGLLLTDELITELQQNPPADQVDTLNEDLKRYLGTRRLQYLKDFNDVTELTGRSVNKWELYTQEEKQEIREDIENNYRYINKSNELIKHELIHLDLYLASLYEEFYQFEEFIDSFILPARFSLQQLIRNYFKHDPYNLPLMEESALKEIRSVLTTIGTIITSIFTKNSLMKEIEERAKNMENFSSGNLKDTIEQIADEKTRIYLEEAEQAERAREEAIDAKNIAEANLEKAVIDAINETNAQKQIEIDTLKNDQESLLAEIMKEKDADFQNILDQKAFQINKLISQKQAEMVDLRKNIQAEKEATIQAEITKANDEKIKALEAAEKQARIELETAKDAYRKSISNQIQTLEESAKNAFIEKNNISKERDTLKKNLENAKIELMKIITEKENIIKSKDDMIASQNRAISSKDGEIKHYKSKYDHAKGYLKFFPWLTWPGQYFNNFAINVDDLQGEDKDKPIKIFALRKARKYSRLVEHKKVFFFIFNQLFGLQFVDKYIGRSYNIPQRLNNLKRYLGNSRNQILNLNKKLESSSAQLSKKIQEYDSLQANEEAKKEMIEDLNAEIVEIQEKNTKLKSDLLAVETERKQMEEILMDFKSAQNNMLAQLDNLPTLTEISNENKPYDLNDTNDPIEVTNSIIHIINQLVDASFSSFKVLRALGKAIGFHVYKKKYGSYAYIKKEFSLLENIRTTISQYNAYKTTMKLIYPTMMVEFELAMAVARGGIAKSEFLSTVTLEPGASQEIVTTTSLTKTTKTSQTSCIIDSNDKTVQDELTESFSESSSTDKSLNQTDTSSTHLGSSFASSQESHVEASVSASGGIFGASVSASVSGGGSQSSASTAERSQDNQSSVEQGLNETLETMNDTVEQSVEITNTKRQETMKSAVEESTTTTTTMTTTKKITNINIGAAINFNYYAASQIYYKIFFVKNAKLFVDNHIYLKVINFRQIKSEFRKIFSEEGATDMLNELEKYMIVEDYQGRYIPFLIKKPLKDLGVISETQSASDIYKYQLQKSAYSNILKNSNEDEITTSDLMYDDFFDEIQGIVLKMDPTSIIKMDSLLLYPAISAQALEENKLNEINERVKSLALENKLVEKKLDMQTKTVERYAKLNEKLDTILDIVAKEETPEKAAKLLALIYKDDQLLESKKILFRTMGIDAPEEEEQSSNFIVNGTI